MGGGGGTPSVQQSKTDTNVTVTNNITGPPINVNVGSEVLSPIANTFQPLAAGLQNSLQSLSVGFQDAETRRAQQETKTADLVQQNAKTQQLMIFGLIGLGAVLVLRR